MMEISTHASNYLLPDLECLNNIGQLLVKQKVERMEVIFGIESNNKYTIKNSEGEEILYAAEENDCCTRMCLGSQRPFDIKIIDIRGNEVIHLHRDFVCCSCGFSGCQQVLEVYSPPGNLLGTVVERWSFCSPKFDIKNANGDIKYKIKGPVCLTNICGDVEFHIICTETATTVGRISKQWSGLLREVFTDADYFGISFPFDLDADMKAVMIGACFLIDFMYFENTNN
ncbi:phospholipid scramblase 1-like [Planococcus citri]|uniref:phospholipid scramblase 1-like n=1 Tax=Planococcus citri TaxID=170843 RepID=UPI0031F82C4E